MDALQSRLIYIFTQFDQKGFLEPFYIFFLLQVFQEVGVPPGVLNLVHGLGSKAGEALVKHPDVKVISFTGSTLIGRHIAKVAAPMMKKLSLELGGKNAALVFADANLDQA